MLLVDSCGKIKFLQCGHIRSSADLFSLFSVSIVKIDFAECYNMLYMEGSSFTLPRKYLHSFRFCVSFSEEKQPSLVYHDYLMPINGE